MLLVVSAGTALLLLDVSVVYVALPAIRADLRRVVRRAAVGGRRVRAGARRDAADRRRAGRPARASRRVVAGLVVFTAMSAVCGAAQSGVQLDVARAAQGLGAAAMFAASLAVLAHEFQGAERGVALGVWGAVTGAALAIGPVIGGALVDGLGWRWIFWMNVPLGALLVWRRCASSPSRATRGPGALDVGGAA